MIPLLSIKRFLFALHREKLGMATLRTALSASLHYTKHVASVLHRSCSMSPAAQSIILFLEHDSLLSSEHDVIADDVHNAIVVRGFY